MHFSELVCLALVAALTISTDASPGVIHHERPQESRHNIDKKIRDRVASAHKQLSHRPLDRTASLKKDPLYEFLHTPILSSDQSLPQPITRLPPIARLPPMRVPDFHPIIAHLMTGMARNGQESAAEWDYHIATEKWVSSMRRFHASLRSREATYYPVIKETLKSFVETLARKPTHHVNHYTLCVLLEKLMDFSAFLSEKLTIPSASPFRPSKGSACKNIDPRKATPWLIPAPFVREARKGISSAGKFAMDMLSVSLRAFSIASLNGCREHTPSKAHQVSVKSILRLMGRMDTDPSVDIWKRLADVDAKYVLGGTFEHDEDGICRDTLTSALIWANIIDVAPGHPAFLPDFE